LHLTALAVCFRSASPGASSSRGAASSGPPSRRPGSHLRTSSGAESRCLDSYYPFGLSRAIVGLSLCCWLSMVGYEFLVGTQGFLGRFCFVNGDVL
jgi:hypothetical protein